jgi:predicted HD phosphohydrolase
VSAFGTVAHLARRFVGSWSRAEPAVEDLAWVWSNLTEGEWRLWSQMAVQDRRHSIEVARRFVSLDSSATQSAIAGALLHDVGKQVAALGTIGRVIATIVGPRGARFRDYHAHERLGAELLLAAGSDPATIELVMGDGPWASTLRHADHI